MVEFVSANPTGPLHVGHGRQAALGDAHRLAAASRRATQVTREFYYNDAGAQIQNLALSVQARARGISRASRAGPRTATTASTSRTSPTISRRDPGHDLRLTIGARSGASRSPYLRAEQDVDLQAFGVSFDVYYLESSLYADGKVDTTVKRLIASGKTYEKDGALWLRTTDYGDDKDRVMRKSDGTYTYFVPDVAYHVTKWQRGFRRRSTCRAPIITAPSRACAPVCRRSTWAFRGATRTTCCTGWSR